MGGLGSLLATNPIVVALANLGGLVGLGFIIWGVGKRAINFAKAVHKTTVRKAIRDFKLRRRRMARLLANDLHLLITAMVGRAISFMLALVVLIIGLMGVPDGTPGKLFNVAKDDKLVMDVITQRVVPAIVLTMLYILAFDTILLCKSIWRNRMTILRHARRAKSAARAHALALEP